MITSYLETIAACTGFANVYLAARSNSWNWLFGILTVSCYAVIFFDVKLYGDMMLQVIFLGFQFYGWHQWLYGGNNNQSLLISRASPFIYLIGLIAFITLFLIFAFLLQNYTDSTTVWVDAFITSTSLVAQWMMCKKWIEHWVLWMIVDMVSIKLYLMKSLYFTSVLYSILFIVCCFGFYTWRNQLKVNSYATA